MTNLYKHVITTTLLLFNLPALGSDTYVRSRIDSRLRGELLHIISTDGTYRGDYLHLPEPDSQGFSITVSPIAPSDHQLKSILPNASATRVHEGDLQVLQGVLKFASGSTHELVQSFDSILKKGQKVVDITHGTDTFPDYLLSLDPFLPADPLTPFTTQGRSQLLPEDHLAAIHFEVGPGALTTALQDRFGSYPFTTCLDAELCSHPALRHTTNDLSSLARKILKTRGEGKEPHERSIESQIKLHRIRYLDLALVDDLIQGRVASIDFIYILPIIESGSRIDTLLPLEIEEALLQFQTQAVRENGSYRSRFRAAFELGSRLDQQGLATHSTLNTLENHIFNARGEINLNLPSTQWSFLAEQLTLGDPANLPVATSTQAVRVRIRLR